MMMGHWWVNQGQDSHFMDFDKPHGKTTKHNKATQRPKNSLVLVWYGLTPPAGNNGITFVLEVSSWNLWRCPTQLPWEAWHHQPFAITRCQKTTSHRSSMRGQNCGTSLSALWQKAPPISIFGVLRLYLQLSTLTIYYIISLFCPTLHCLLQHWIIYHCMSL